MPPSQPRFRPRPPFEARVVGGGLVLTMFFQRIGIPAGDSEVSITMLIGFVVVAILLGSRQLVAGRYALPLYLAAMSLCGLITVGHMIAQSRQSVNSYLLLVLCYLPWIFVLNKDSARRTGSAWVGELYVNLMVILGVVGILQYVTQATGIWTFNDPLALIPDAFLLHGFNTFNPLEYDSPIIKPQAFVFLEPSFFSQFLGLAAVVALVRRAPVWKMLTLLAALALTFSGTGIILFAVGVAVALVVDPKSIRFPFVLIASAGAVGALLTGQLAVTVARLGEVNASDSSLSLRFVKPYIEVTNGFLEVPRRLLIGAGAGSVERILEGGRGSTSLPVVYNIPSKLLFEYGVFAGGMGVWFILRCIFTGTRELILPIAMFTFLFLLSGSLLSPQTLLVAWMLLLIWRRD